MSSIKRNIILVLLIFISFNGFGQLGYLGNRFGLEIGLGTNFELRRRGLDFYNYQTDRDLLLPKINLGVLIETKKGSVMHLRGVYNQLPNSRINLFNETFKDATITTIADTAWTKSDNFQLAFGVRKFRELSPIGVYFDFDFKGNFVFNKTLYSANLHRNITDYNVYQTRIESTVLSNITLVPEIGFSLGATFPLNERLLLDVGGKLNFALGKFKAEEGDTIEISDFDLFHRIISSRKVFATNLLEVYVNIVLFP